MTTNKCKHCGADDALHHYQTNQCPEGGREAPLGRRQEWQATTFEPVQNAQDALEARITALEAHCARLEEALRCLSATQSQGAWQNVRAILGVTP